MLRSSLHDYSDAYIHVKGTIINANTADQGQSDNGSNKKVIKIVNKKGNKKVQKQNKQYTSRWCLLYWCSYDSA